VLRTNALVGGLDVARRGRAVEEVERVPAVLDALAKHIYDAPPGDLTLEPGQEFAACGGVVVQVERLGDLRLRGAQELGQLRQVDGVLAVIVA